MNIRRILPIIGILALVACGRSETAEPAPSSTEASSTEGSQLTINVTPPFGTTEETELGFVVLNEVYGWPYDQTVHPLSRLSDDLWGTQITVPTGTLLRYRYIRMGPSRANETFSDGSPITSRVVYVRGPTALDDVVASWSDAPYDGPIGRILGRLVDATTNEPLSDLIASVGGKVVFSDSEGNFRVDGLSPGLHTLTVFSPSGEFLPAQQGVLIAAESTTPAQLPLHRANLVDVTFEVTVPEETIEGIPIRLAGNLQQFGHIFTELPGGLTNALALMPTMSEVDPTHYKSELQLYAGSHLRYTYTLGDGLINSERDPNGDPILRELIIPEEAFVVQDEISRWDGGEGSSILFWVTVPEITPHTDVISLQLGDVSPIPMWRIGDYEWFYAVHNYPDIGQSVSYRYCRNQLCGIADDAETAASGGNERSVTPGQSQLDVHDVVENWLWWGSDSRSDLQVTEVVPRSDFEVGVELIPTYDPNWDLYLDAGLSVLSDLGANTVILSPTWRVGENDPYPEVWFDPASSPFRDRLIETVNRAQSLGLAVALHPRLTFPDQDPNNWWLTAARDEGWWDVWYERYRAFILYYAGIAAQTDAAKLILGGEEVGPSLPGVQLIEGEPSGVPIEAETHWEALITSVREIFPGTLAFELEFENALQLPPDFVDQTDAVHIYWHAPLALEDQSGLSGYTEQVKAYIDGAILVSDVLANKALFFSVEYPSVRDSLRGCPPSSTTCIPARAFDLGLDPDPERSVDMDAQARAFHAVLTEAVSHTEIEGVFARRYNPFVELQDKSSSVAGKEAYNLLRQWFHAIRNLSP